MSEHFSLWRDRCLAFTDARNEAQEFLCRFCGQESRFAELCATPQSGPYHEEGETVQSHLLRALTFLYAVQHNAYRVHYIDEVCAAKQYEGFFIRLQRTLCTERAFLSAYILAHDIGKKDTAIQDEQGWHYKGHAHKGAGEEYGDFREACLNSAGCPTAERKLLRELIRIHMDINWEMSQKKETRILAAAHDIAERQGINSERFLTLLPAAFFLDVIVGSLESRLSGFETIARLIHYAEQEYRAFPQRKEEDALMLARKEKEVKKALLITYGLSPEEWFLRLHTPYGKERGVVVRIIERFMKGIENREDVRYLGEEHARELRMRSVRFRENKNK